MFLVNNSYQCSILLLRRLTFVHLFNSTKVDKDFKRLFCFILLRNKTVLCRWKRLMAWCSKSSGAKITPGTNVPNCDEWRDPSGTNGPDSETRVRSSRSCEFKNQILSRILYFLFKIVFERAVASRCKLS